MSGDEPEETAERIASKDATMFEVPVFGGHPITYNEVHAVQIGVASGVITGLLYALGTVLFTFEVDDVFPVFLYTLASTMLTTLSGYALLGSPMFRSTDHDSEDYPHKPIGIATIRHEPWYFLVPYVSVGTVVFTVLFVAGMVLTA